MNASPPETGSSPGAARVLTLKRGEERRLAAGHLWVFSNEVDSARTPLSSFQPGELARLATQRGAFIGFAYVNPHALICARLLSRAAAAPVDVALLERRLRAALSLRERLGAPRFCRWVFGESDALPGLVLDRYGDLIVGQIATAGMERLKDAVAAAVRTVLEPAALFWKNDSAARELEHLPQGTAAAFGEVPPEVQVLEGALRFSAPLAGGQKTGWYYDQSANRARLKRYLTRGARVLDVCSYVGGFGISALHHGAAQALCVDASQAALEFAHANAARNGLALESLRADAFDALKGLFEQGRRFDAVILDPPAFIKRKKDSPKGQAAYRKLNQLALSLIEGEGLLLSCSCSYHLAAAELVAAVQAAALKSGRGVQILECAGQSPDHPVHPAIPETRYLKALFCRVTRGTG